MKTLRSPLKQRERTRKLGKLKSVFSIAILIAGALSPIASHIINSVSAAESVTITYLNREGDLIATDTYPIGSNIILREYAPDNSGSARSWIDRTNFKSYTDWTRVSPGYSGLPYNPGQPITKNNHLDGMTIFNIQQSITLRSYNEDDFYWYDGFNTGATNPVYFRFHQNFVSQSGWVYHFGVYNADVNAPKFPFGYEFTSPTGYMFAPLQIQSVVSPSGEFFGEWFVLGDNIGRWCHTDNFVNPETTACDVYSGPNYPGEPVLIPDNVYNNTFWGDIRADSCIGYGYDVTLGEYRDLGDCPEGQARDVRISFDVSSENYTPGGGFAVWYESIEGEMTQSLLPCLSDGCHTSVPDIPNGTAWNDAVAPYVPTPSKPGGFAYYWTDELGNVTNMEEMAAENPEIRVSKTYTLHYVESEEENIILAVAGNDTRIYDGTSKTVPNISIYACMVNDETSELDCDLQSESEMQINGGTLLLDDGNYLTYAPNIWQESAYVNVGDYPVLVDESSFSVANSYETDITSRYNIFTQNGLLRITPRLITVEILDVDMSDNNVQSLKALVVDAVAHDALVLDHFLATTTVEVQVVNGVPVLLTDLKILDGSDNDVTSNSVITEQFAVKENPETPKPPINPEIPDTDKPSPEVPNTGSKTGPLGNIKSSMTSFIVSGISIAIIALLAIRKRKVLPMFDKNNKQENG